MWRRSLSLDGWSMEKQRYDGWYNNMAYPGLATNHLFRFIAFIPKVQQQGLVIDLALCVASIRKVEQGRGCHHYKNTVSCEKAKGKKLC